MRTVFTAPSLLLVVVRWMTNLNVLISDGDSPNAVDADVSQVEVELGTFTRRTTATRGQNAKREMSRHKEPGPARHEQPP